MPALDAALKKQTPILSAEDKLAPKKGTSSDMMDLPAYTQYEVYEPEEHVKIESHNIPPALDYLMENYFDSLSHLRALVVARRAYMSMGI